jgi:exosortase A
MFKQKDLTDLNCLKSIHLTVKSRLNKAIDWPAHLVFVSCLSLVLLAFNQTWLSMERQWSISSAHGHGYLVLPIALWLSLRKVKALKSYYSGYSFFGLFALTVSTCIWLIGSISGINIVAGVGVVAMIPSLVLMIYGLKITRFLAFPLGFLFFMVPAGDFLVPLLQKSTADATVWAIRNTGIPIFQEGNFFSLPSGQWSVIETCAGLNYVIAACVLGSLYAYLNYQTYFKRAAFIIAVILVSVFSNWLRAYLTVLTGHFTQMKWGPGHEHVTFGWVLFGIIVGGLFWFCSRWSDVDDLISQNDSNSKFPVFGLADEPKSPARVAKNYGLIFPKVMIFAATLCVVMSAKYYASGVLMSSTTGIALDRIKSIVGDGQVDPDSFSPAYTGWRSKIELYSSDKTNVYVSYYSHQNEGNELVSSENRLIDESGLWKEVSSRNIDLSDTNGVLHKIKEFELIRYNKKVLVWQYYASGGKVSVNKLSAKIDTLRSMLLGLGDQSVAVVISAEYDTKEISQVRDRLLGIVSAIRPVVLELTHPLSGS